jgi:membrane carboxypeptidase/penicillin-binding protein
VGEHDVPLPGEVQNPQRTLVQWADGSPMARVGTVNRVSVPLSQVSHAARQAVLAAEDRDFYDSPGISPRGIARRCGSTCAARRSARAARPSPSSTCATPS